MEHPQDIAIFMLLGIVITAFILTPAYLAHRRVERLRATGQRVRGMVASCHFYFGRPSGWKSVIRFTTLEGQVIEATYIRDLSLRLAAGQTVWVVYNELNPRNFVL